MPSKGDEAEDTLNQYVTSPAIQFFRYRLLRSSLAMETYMMV
jgi:hypothetical protein